MDQGVNQSGTKPIRGAGSFHVSNSTVNGGYNGNFSGWVFSPGLAASAGQPSSGATANLMTATFWIKAGSAVADGSNIELDLGTPAGDDRNTFLAMTNRADVDGGLQIRISEPDGATGDFFATQIAKTGLSRTHWHRIDITARFVDGVANDTFSVKVDGVDLVNSEPTSPNVNTTSFGTFEGYRDGIVPPYAGTNRLISVPVPRRAAYGAFADDAPRVSTSTTLSTGQQRKPTRRRRGLLFDVIRSE